MTKEEMIKRFLVTKGEANYEEAQRRIKEAMLRGENYVYLPRPEFESQFDWVVCPETIERLKEDGFAIDKEWQPYEYFSVEWYEEW